MQNVNHPTTWLGIEGIRNGKPELIRARRIPDDAIGDSRFPYLFVLTRWYPRRDETELPNDEEYGELRQFEEQLIDTIEQRGIGILSWVRTGEGRVRYYLYVRDTDEIVCLVNDVMRNDQQIDMAADEDRQWQYYRDVKKGFGF